MATLLSRVAPVLLIISVVNCSSEASVTEPDIPGFALEGDWDGKFNYEYEEKHDLWRCTFVHANGTAYPFECGTLLIGLKPGVRVDDLQDLLQAIGAHVIRADYHDPWSNAAVRVDIKSERDALLRASSDPRLRYASLNFSGPATCMMVGGCRTP